MVRRASVRSMIIATTVLLIIGVLQVRTARAANVTCAQLQTALLNANDGDVLTLTQMCTGDNFTMATGVNITLRGAPGAGLDGTGATANPLLDGADVGATVIENLTFRDSAGAVNGGAIHISGNSVPKIRNNIFNSNSVSGSGGAVNVQSNAAGGTVAITNNRFGDGTAARANSALSGGALALSVNPADVTIANNRIVGNAGTDAWGGLIVFSNGPSSSLRITNNIVRENSAGGIGGGAGIFAWSDSTTMQGNTFADNLVLANTPGPNYQGGGAFVSFLGGTRTYSQSGNVFRNNRILGGDESTGGGQYLIAEAPSTLTSTNDRFVGNEILGIDGEGGGLSVEGNDDVDVVTFTGRNLVAAGNSIGTGGLGGGIYSGISCLAPCNTRLNLRNSTIVANTVGAGGSGTQLGAGVEDEVVLRNSIVFGAGPMISGFGTTTASFTDACSAGAPLPGTGNMCKNPRLVDGAAGNIHQTRRSPTREKGSNALVPANLTKDIDGDPRKIDSDGNGTRRVDMGADEARRR